ncbi:MAG: YcxB family protein [Candidatus Nanopelagicales bacterium]
MGDARTTYLLAFAPTEDEVVRAHRVLDRATGARVERALQGSVLCALGLLECAVAAAPAPGADVVGVSVGLAIVALGLLIATGAVHRWTSRRRVRHYVGLRSERTCEVSAEGLRTSVLGVETRIPWSAVGRVVVDDDMLVLLLRGQPTMLYLPRRGLEPPDAWTQLVEVVETAHRSGHQGSDATEDVASSRHDDADAGIRSRQRRVVGIAALAICGVLLVLTVLGNLRAAAAPSDLVERLRADGICSGATTEPADRGEVYACTAVNGDVIKVASPSTAFIYQTTDYRIDGPGWMAVVADKATAERVAGLLQGRISAP